ncbi:MAG: 23S rRNA (uracil(1939)-C(5))-methyltransferase RlmD [Ignavibacteriae bacterium]|nr:23S rRNA (uracil(1939)-C(5))-methyltransferase RlmD [Ignavibacteriota bacterium]MCB9243952.1 23S rRNA (uracil(1939)-C(5))-methyltransferase RlmD [Ignavibacteriales bacterium]
MKKGDEIEIIIEDMNDDGRGVGRTGEGMVIFADKVVPGDKALVRIRKKRNKYAEASFLELLEPSKYRIDPRCEYFGTCGGCKIQNLEYDRQLAFKKGVVENAFKRIGGFDGLEFPEVMGSDDIFFYRNKMEFSFSDDKWVVNPDDAGEEKERFALGLHVPRFHSKIIDIHECFLQSEVSNRILNFTRDFFKERAMSVYSTQTHEGFLRFLIIREGKNTNELMVNLVTYEHDEGLMNEYAEKLRETAPEVTTLVNGLSNKRAQVAFAEDEKVIFGSGIIHEKLIRQDGKEFSFKISPNSFFQTNTMQAQKLYDVALEFGEFTKEDKVLDLYCGAGSIGIFISDKVDSVLGVELIEDAISNANENMTLNSITNAEFIVSDIKDFLLSNDVKAYNKIILDPPRSGLHPKICEILSETNLDRIVYVSCNPSTQARDLKLICGMGKYGIEKIQPVDMFPHTYHVENVISLVRIG